MELLDVIRTRRSARAFLSDPVSRELVQEILADANTQTCDFNSGMLTQLFYEEV